MIEALGRVAGRGRRAAREAGRGARGREPGRRRWGGGAAPRGARVVKRRAHVRGLRGSAGGRAGAVEPRGRGRGWARARGGGPWSAGA